MEVLGYIMIVIGGGLLQDVPFPRFIIALMLVVIGHTFVMVNA